MERNVEQEKITEESNTDKRRSIDENTLNISWVATLKCNQKCWYCYWKYEKDKREEKKNVNFTLAIRDFIFAQEKKNINFHIYGGEPTVFTSLPFYIYALYNDYRLKDYNLNVTMNTNLMKSKRYFKIYNQYPNFHIIATLHINSLEKRWQLDEWFEKVYLMNDIEVVLMNTKTYGDLIYNIKDRYCKNLKCTIRQIEQEETQDYKNWKNYMCKPGFIIRENGDVMRCWSDMRYENFKIMNIYEDKIKKLDDWKLCEHPVCYCPHDRPRMKISDYSKCIKN